MHGITCGHCGGLSWLRSDGTQDEHGVCPRSGQPYNAPLKPDLGPWRPEPPPGPRPAFEKFEQGLELLDFTRAGVVHVELTTDVEAGEIVYSRYARVVASSPIRRHTDDRDPGDEDRRPDSRPELEHAHDAIDDGPPPRSGAVRSNRGTLRLRVMREAGILPL